MVLKEKLQQLLESNRLSLSDLSKETGISVKTLFNWSSGSVPRDLNQVKKVADFFKISIDELCFKTLKNDREPISKYRDEIFCGKFEIILRPVDKK